MSQKTPNQLEAGMVLASDVTNLDGHTLFNKGLSLNERHIEILLMWGVPQVEIEGGGDNEQTSNLEQFDPVIVMKAKQLTDQRFKLAKSSHPAVDIIHRISILNTAKQLQETKPTS